MNYFGDTVQDGASLKMKNLAKYICYGGLRSRYSFMFLVSPSIFRMCSNYAAYVIWRSMKPLLGERAEEEGEEWRTINGQRAEEEEKNRNV